MISPWANSSPIEPKFGFARTRDLAFGAIRRMWKLRQSQGMTQVDLAARLDRDPAWVSKKLSGPTNWTLRTFGDLVDALDGEVEIHIADLRTGRTSGNYDAYSGYGEEPIERRPTSWVVFETPDTPVSARLEVAKPIGTNSKSTLAEAL